MPGPGGHAPDKTSREVVYSRDGVGGWIGEESERVPVVLEVQNSINRHRAGLEIGAYQLNHYGVNGREYVDCPMRLDVILWDPENRYKAALREAMHCAALSGYGSLHVELHGLTPDPKETNTPIELIREKGHGPSYSFEELKVWPEIFLRNAPSWAINLHDMSR